MNSVFTDEQIASVTHAANKAYCEALGDTSQACWAEAPQWQRDSAIAGVANKRAFPDMTPAQQHESWFCHKVADGWTYGEVKDAEARTHPCMVPYDKLPPSQRAKDHIFGAICAAMLSVDAPVL